MQQKVPLAIAIAHRRYFSTRPRPHRWTAGAGRQRVASHGLMVIHCLTTGFVRLKHAFLYPASGPRRQLNLFLPGAWSQPVPIHCWAVEHEGRVLLVDTGESASVRNIPFARFEVAPEQ